MHTCRPVTAAHEQLSCGHVLCLPGSVCGLRCLSSCSRPSTTGAVSWVAQYARRGMRVCEGEQPGSCALRWRAPLYQ